MRIDERRTEERGSREEKSEGREIEKMERNKEINFIEQLVTQITA